MKTKTNAQLWADRQKEQRPRRPCDYSAEELRAMSTSDLEQLVIRFGRYDITKHGLTLWGPHHELALRYSQTQKETQGPPVTA
jgi:hypothetical protein